MGSIISMTKHYSVVWEGLVEKGNRSRSDAVAFGDACHEVQWSLVYRIRDRMRFQRNDTKVFYEGTHEAFGDGPRHFEPWSSDEDDTCAGTQLS
ncbi:hypothetical protein TNCV_3809611 [Trichonephila clavipes]|nr:hypothetical protein TNCV_3809611 [Trichonephila clavipes]